MIAGTLAVVETGDGPLEPYIRDNGYPALTVHKTQTTVGDATPQSGAVAGRVESSATRVSTGQDSGEPHIDVERTDSVETLATDWYADVTGSGIVLAESVAANEELPFPIDVIGGVLERSIERRQIDVQALHDRWDGDGGLSDVWMAGTDHHGAAMAYHGQATIVDPTMGLGFKRSWNGTTIKGVVWEGGYVALYNARHPADGLQFVADEILPFTESWDPDEHEDQTDFEEFGGGS